MVSPRHRWDGLEDQWGEGPGVVQSTWRFKWWVAALVVAGAMVGFVWSTFQPTQYEGVVRVFLDDADVADSSRHVRARAEFFKSPAVLQRTSESLAGRMSAREVEDRLHIGPSTNTDLITIRMLDDTPEGAADAANAVVNAYQQVFIEQAAATTSKAMNDLEPIRLRLEAELADIRAKRVGEDPTDPIGQINEDAKALELRNLANLKVQGAGRVGAAPFEIALLEPSAVSKEAVAPDPLRASTLGALFGLIAGALLAWWLTGREQEASRRRPNGAVDEDRALAPRPHAALANHGQ